MGRSVDLRIAILIVSLGSLFVACSNEPGALRMELESKDSRHPQNQSLLLTTTLVASDSPVCLSKARVFDWEIRPARMKESCASSNQQEAYCGTGIIESMILFPYVWIGAWMDVGDLAGRFDVIKAGECRKHELAIPMSPSCPPGDYEVSVRLNNRRGFCGDFLPLPLFWRLYSPQVQATISIQIVGTIQPTTQPNVN